MKGGFEMPKVALLNQSGQNVGEVNLEDTVFGITPNQQALYDVVKAIRANKRQGTHKAKTRSEVRGGGRKPWRQKGTGRARQGSTRSPQWVGGGVVFGPTPRDYTLKVNRKVRQLALKSALSQKVQDDNMIVLDSFNIDSPKTKTMVEILSNLKIESKVLIILPKGDTNVELSARNIPKTVVSTVSQASVYDIMNSSVIITTQDAVKNYEEVLV